ncbi:sensor histidine kinase [Desulfoplanes formicivorans]|uniref:histidine kinase n=1 Tax=Desulfoplanes formicivorans TaxID=1592317 RepID=A0A194AKP7_9BACT|nr:HAMP domain-containing sensor histidine kinase [Desulfoplanes formicivorans]GAU09888.1 two-component sensor histidine kinase [Desulfoplanes formicivorans]
MIRPASSLFTRILCWFFLNLILVGAALGTFIFFQPQLDLHAFFGMQRWNRLRVAAALMVHDLYNAPRKEWSAILARHARVNQVDFVLVFGDGTRFSSRPVELPDTVRVRVEHAFKGPFSDRRPAPPPPARNPVLPGSGPDQDILSPSGEQPPGLGEGLEGLDLIPGRPVLRMHTSDPDLYWTGIMLPPPPKPRDFPTPFVLMVVSDSASGNGFFFDARPWVLVAAVVLLISVLFWIPMVRNITRPLSRMTRATEEIASGRFDVVLDEPRRDEIGRLARAINHMTTRLAAFVTGQKRFLGDISHELGSPLARIQFGLGVLDQRLDGANRQRLQNVMDDVAHLSQLVGELLAFSRADLSAQSVALEPVDLLWVVREAVRREKAPDSEVIIDVDPDLRVLASPDLLTRALANLVRNGVKYAGKAGPIHIVAHKDKGWVNLEVKDSGPGVPEEYLDQLFEPFFRPEPSRNRSLGGVGLGLSIVKTCVESCKGRVFARNQKPHGFVVTIILGRC